jgi:hypothetical protein
MFKKNEVLGYIFIVLLVLLLLAILYKNKTSETFVINPSTIANFSSTLQTAGPSTIDNPSYDGLYTDPALGVNHDIKNRACKVYNISDKDLGLDDDNVDTQLRQLCDSGFFDQTPEYVAKRLNYLRTMKQTNTQEYRNLQWYQKLKPNMPNGACKVQLFDWSEPNVTADGIKYPIKNTDANRIGNRGDPKDWAFCYHPLTSANPIDTAQPIIGNGLITTNDVVNPYNDGNPYSRISFTTFTVDDFKKNPVQLPGTNINDSICAPANVNSAVLGKLPTDNGVFLAFQLDKNSIIKYFTPTKFNTKTYRMEAITDPQELFNIYGSLFTITGNGNTNILTPKNLNAQIYTMINDICINTNNVGTIFENSGRIIDVKGPTQFIFSLSKNVKMSAKELSRSTEDVTSGDVDTLKERLMNFQANEQTIQDTIEQLQKALPPKPINPGDHSNDSVLSPSTANAINQFIQQENLYAAQELNIIHYEQTSLDNIKKQIAIINKLIQIYNNFDSSINTIINNRTLGNSVADWNQLSISNGFVNKKFIGLDYITQSNDNNFYVYINSTNKNTMCKDCDACNRPTPSAYCCEICTLNKLLTALTGLQQKAQGELDNAQAEQEMALKAAADAAFAKWKNMGCFKDNTSSPFLPNNLGSVKSARECSVLAANNNYVTMGLQNGNCYAGPDGIIYNMLGAQTCPSNGLGGVGINQIYSLNHQLPIIPPPPPPPPKPANQYGPFRFHFTAPGMLLIGPDEKNGLLQILKPLSTFTIVNNLKLDMATPETIMNEGSWTPKTTFTVQDIIPFDANNSFTWIIYTPATIYFVEHHFMTILHYPPPVGAIPPNVIGWHFAEPGKWLLGSELITSNPSVNIELRLKPGTKFKILSMAKPPKNNSYLTTTYTVTGYTNFDGSMKWLNYTPATPFEAFNQLHFQIVG